LCDFLVPTAIHPEKFIETRPIVLLLQQTEYKNKQTNKKAARETQTLRAGCSKAEPKFFAPPQTPSRGRGTTKI